MFPWLGCGHFNFVDVLWQFFFTSFVTYLELQVVIVAVIGHSCFFPHSLFLKQQKTKVKMREILAREWGCGHFPACTCLTVFVAQSQRSGVTTGGLSWSKVYHSLRGPAASLRPYSTHVLHSWVFSSPTFSNPSKWLRQHSWQQQEKQTVGCRALSHQLEISLWKDFLLTHCRFHQSQGPSESGHPEQLPSDPASSCWFVLFGHFKKDGVAFDRSDNRTWMRSLV